MPFQKGHGRIRTKESYIRGGKNISKAMKGRRLSEKHKQSLRKPKSKPSWFKGKKRPEIRGQNHWNWKGNKAGYRSIHTWVEVRLGKAGVCVVCGKNKGRIHWANLDHTYKRNVKDYLSLCPKHHRLWDKHKLPINLFEWAERGVLT